MRKALILVLACFLLFSCHTGQEGYYTQEEKEEALTRLSDDIMAYVASGLYLSGASFLPALPDTFRAYEQYVPQYAAIADEYTGKLADILKPVLTEAYPLVAEASKAVSERVPVEAFRDDSGLTALVWNEVYQDVVEYYLGRLVELEGALREAYSVSEREFSLVRDAYLNLNRVGYRIYIPAPEPAVTGVLAEVMADSLMYQLADAEKVLKNRPPETSDSPYRIFWSYN